MELKGGTNNNKIANVKHTGFVKSILVQKCCEIAVTNRNQTGWTSELEEGLKTNKI